MDKEKVKTLINKVKDRHSWPRRWWYPPDPEPVTTSGDGGRNTHEQCSITIRRGMTTLLVVAFYCWLVAVGTPDSSLFVPSGQFQIPYANVPMSFQGFLFIGPGLLLVITIYMHLFIAYLRRLEAGGVAKKIHERLPTLFNLESRFAHMLAVFIFYWVTPITLAAITVRGSGKVEWALFGGWITVLSTIALLWVQVRRCAKIYRLRFNSFRFGLIIMLLAGAGYASWDLATYREESIFRRNPNLFRAHLKDAWMPGANLIEANLDNANLQGAKLQGAQMQGASLENVNFEGANLEGANLEGANLDNANMQGANLMKANLKGANLRFANLEGANIFKANLKGANPGFANLEGANLRFANLNKANLRDANLRDANLNGAKGLSCEQLQKATNWQTAYRDPGLACGVEIPIPPKRRKIR